MIAPCSVLFPAIIENTLQKQEMIVTVQMLAKQSRKMETKFKWITWKYFYKKKKIQNLNYSNISEEHVKILSLKLGTLKGIQAFCSVKHYHTNLKVNKTKTPRSYKCYLWKRNTLKSEEEGNNVQSSDLQFIFHVLHFNSCTQFKKGYFSSKLTFCFSLHLTSLTKTLFSFPWLCK